MQEGIDRTAQFFIKPLFLQDYTDKELNAVNSEFEADLGNDEWRQYSILSQIAHKDTYFKDFSIGNISTLKKPNLRENLISFWKKTYSSNLMTAFVYGKDSLQNLEEISIPILSKIQNQELERINYKDKKKPFDSKNCKKIIK